MLYVIFSMFSKILTFSEITIIESSDDSKGKIYFLRGTKLITILPISERKFYNLKENSSNFVFKA